MVTPSPTSSDTANITGQLSAPEGSSHLAECVTRLETKVLDLEARLLEQDHRWIGVVVGMYQAFTRFPKTDPRRSAALKALVWKLTSPATVATISVLLLSVVGVAVAMHANYLLARQNQRIDQQTLLLEAQRRSASFATEFSEVSRSLEQEIAVYPANKTTEQAEKFKISATLAARISYLSRTSRPYYALELETSPVSPISSRSATLTTIQRLLALVGAKDLWLDESPLTLTPRPLSPERAQILLLLLNVNASTKGFPNLGLTFESADLRNSPLRGKSLQHLNFAASSFVGANLKRVNFAGSNLSQTDLTKVCMTRANLFPASFSGADLTDAGLQRASIQWPSGLFGSNLTRTNLSGVVVQIESWLDDLAKPENNTIGFVRSDWKLEKLSDEDVAWEASQRPALDPQSLRYKVVPTKAMPPHEPCDD